MSLLVSGQIVQITERNVSYQKNGKVEAFVERRAWVVKSGAPVLVRLHRDRKVKKGDEITFEVAASLWSDKRGGAHVDYIDRGL